VIDQLAQEYDGRAVFIEYNIDAPVSLDRMDYWWYGYPSSYANLPLTMVDSGYQTHAGFSTYNMSYAQHKSMIDDALARPAGADVSATWERVGDAARFNVRVTNRTNVTLGPANQARVFVLVYEDAEVLYTGRFMRSYTRANISALAYNATANFTLTTPAMSGVDWEKLHFIAWVDYRPEDSAGAYDMLQAAVAAPSASPITPAPRSLMFFAEPGGTPPAGQVLSLTGPDGLSWTATPSAAWIQVSPGTSSLPTGLQVNVNPAALSAGVHVGKITFSSPGVGSVEVSVVASVGDVNWVHLPLVADQ
jgi:hypothetical protein